MTILDRYITRSFLFSLLIFATSFMTLYIVADLMFQLRQAGTKPDFGVMGLVKYYLVNTPLFLYRLAPFLVLMSAMFTVTRLSRQGELIAVRAAGISLFRTTVPLFAVALIIGIGITLFQELYVPKLADDIRRTTAKQVHLPPMLKDRRGNSFVALLYNVGRMEMHDAYLHHRGRAESYHVSAKRARWEKKGDLAGWRFFDGKRYPYDEEGKLVIENGRAKIEEIPEKGWFVPSDLKPATVESMRGAAAYLSIGDLSREHAANPSQHHLKVEIHVRIAYPLTFIVLLLIGLPCVLIPETKNLFLGIGLCLGICLCYVIVFVFFTELGNNGTLSPFVAAWMPLVLFFSLGVVLFDSIRS